MILPTANANQAEWASLIASIKDTLPSTPRTYPEPPLINRTIDHTQLALDATPEQIDTLCAEAIEHQFATVCVRLGHVPRAVSNLRNNPDVGVACVVGFHEGTYSTADKVQEARDAVEHGATELDMVLNYPLLQAGQYVEVHDDVRAVRDAVPSTITLKVILETSQLDRDQVIAASIISCHAGANYIKTSTGFNGPGATLENVALMRATAEALGMGTKVKASGGVRSAKDTVQMVQAGAERIGSSSGVKIMQEARGEQVSGEAQGY